MQEIQETRVWSMGREDPLEQDIATHSSILAWEIPWTEELGRLQSTGSQELDTTEQLTFHFIFHPFSEAEKWNTSRKSQIYSWGQDPESPGFLPNCDRGVHWPRCLWVVCGQAHTNTEIRTMKSVHINKAIKKTINGQERVPCICKAV